MKFCLIIILFCFSILKNVPAQNNQLCLPGTDIRTLHSETIGQDFELYIKLPWNYEKTDTAYPVLFTTDANRTFPIYSTTSFVYETPGMNNLEIIIVGIAYKVSLERIKGLAEWAYLRNRDLRPERSLESETYWKERLSGMLGENFQYVESGKAANFLEFIKKEVIPFVENNYRVSQDRGIAGYSLGGLFVLYTLFHAPDSFNKYFAGSPSSIQKCIEYENEFAKSHRNLDAKVLITANQSEQETRKGIEVLEKSMKKHRYSGLELHTSFFNNETHISGGPGAISRALNTLYYSDY